MMPLQQAKKRLKKNVAIDTKIEHIFEKCKAKIEKLRL
jgi:hypothetical protein